MIYLVVGIVVALILAFVFSQRSGKGEQEDVELPDDCCGAHEVCETDTLLSASDKAEYFEDEELDRFKDMEASAYTKDQIEEFREVLFTLKEKEVAAWLRSLQLRQINPPNIIREEALMIVADLRGVLD